MKWIYIIVLCSFSCLVFGQDMKIGFLDSDAILLEMQETYFLDSLQKVISRKNALVGKRAVKFYATENKKAMEYCTKICFISEKELKSIEYKLQQYEIYILNLEKEINQFDSLLRVEVAIYLRKGITNLASQYDFDLILDKDIVFYRKENLDITKKVVEQVKARKTSEWKNDNFLKFVEDAKIKYDLFTKKIAELLEFRFGHYDVKIIE